MLKKKKEKKKKFLALTDPGFFPACLFFYQSFKISLRSVIEGPNTGFESNSGQFRVKYQRLSTPPAHAGSADGELSALSHQHHLLSESPLLKIASSTPNAFLFSTHVPSIHDK